VLAFTLPILFAGPGSYSDGQTTLASAGSIVDPWNVWYPFASVTTETLPVDSARLIAHLHRTPTVARLSHPLIVLLAFGLPLALALRRRRFGVSGSDAVALFALLALLRCALDPVDNLYYHLPLLLALVGWDAMSCRDWPMRGLAGVAVAAVFWRWSRGLAEPQVLNIAYIALAATLVSAIAVHLFRRPESMAGRSYGGASKMADGLGALHP
jgi:hypothetical protein